MASWFRFFSAADIWCVAVGKENFPLWKRLKWQNKRFLSVFGKGLIKTVLCDFFFSLYIFLYMNMYCIWYRPSTKQQTNKVSHKLDNIVEHLLGEEPEFFSPANVALCLLVVWIGNCVLICRCCVYSLLWCPQVFKISINAGLNDHIGVFCFLTNWCTNLIKWIGIGTCIELTKPIIYQPDVTCQGHI